MVRSPAYREFWAKLKRGEYISDVFKRFTKEGGEVWIRAAYNPIADASGKIVKVVKFATDVTQAVLDQHDGNISQALLMMNGQELQNAIPLAAGEVAKSLREGTVNEAPTRLAMATLNREATENEEKAFRNRYRSLVRSLPPETAMKTATEDMLWAYLNSSEFVSVH